MYGGRAIDDFDRRVLKTYMDEYMGDFIFDTFQPFHFYHNEAVDYVIPSDGTRDHYLDYIEELPLSNTPEVFGLHMNAEIGYFTRAAKDMWSQLVELQPQTGESGSGISREEFIGKIASDIQVCGPLHRMWLVACIIMHMYVCLGQTSRALQVRRYSKKDGRSD